MNNLHLCGNNDLSYIPQKSGYRELEKIVMYDVRFYDIRCINLWRTQPAGWQGCTDYELQITNYKLQVLCQCLNLIEH